MALNNISNKHVVDGRKRDKTKGELPYYAFQKNCINCGELVHIKGQRDIKERKYCSHKCRSQWLYKTKRISQAFLDQRGSSKQRWERAKNFGSFYTTEKSCAHCGSMFLPTSANQKRCRACTPNRTASKRFREHGLTERDYQRILQEQNYCCALCGNVPNYKLVVDHCHKTGRIRGLLCHKCNGALWFVEHHLSQAVLYLSKNTNYGYSEKHIENGFRYGQVEKDG